MPIVIDPAYDPNVLPGGVRSNLFRSFEQEEKPSLMQTLHAAIVESNIVGAGLERLHEDTVKPAIADKPREYFLQPSGKFLKDDGINADFDPLDYAEGYEDYADVIASASDPADLLNKMSRIQKSRENLDVLRRAGWVGTTADIAAAVIDPTLVAAMLIPEAQVFKANTLRRIIGGAVTAAGTQAVYEAGLQSLSETRTGGQSLFNIGGAAVIGGVLGSITRGVSRAEMKPIEDAITAELHGIEKSAGAAAVRQATTLERESLAVGGKQSSAAMSKVPLLATDFDRIMATDLIAAKEGLQELADIPAIVGKNLTGERTATAVESLVAKHDARVADFSDLANAQWKKYRDRTGRERMSKQEFYENIARASRNDDTHIVPEIDASAKFLRSRVFDPLKNEAERFGLFAAQKEGGELGEVVGAKSYFRRMYDRKAIIANREEWNRVLKQWFSRNSDAVEAEVQAAIDDVTDKILHADVGQSNWGNKITVPAAGPLKERTLDIPDELIERFLINDPLKVSRAYVRDLAPQVELARRFQGDVEMKSVIGRIDDEVRLREQKIRDSSLTDKQKNEAIESLQAQRKTASEALMRMRDRLLGKAGRFSPTASESERRAVMAARNWRNLVMASKGGGIAVTGGAMDMARIAAHYGFGRTLSKMAKLATSPEFRALSKAQARRFGAMVEVALSRRAQIAYDGAITEGWSQKLAEGVFKYTGLNHIMDFNRMLAASLFEDKVMRAAEKAAAGSLKKFDLAELASLGLGEKELKAIAKQLKKHGGEIDGAKVSGSADWDDPVLAEMYDAAVLKESRIVVQQPGIADRVWWMDKELGKVIGQLKTFALSSPVRMAMAPLQMIGQGQYGKAARFVGFMMVGGYLTHAIRQTVSNQPVETDPGAAAMQAITETGLAGVLPDIASPWARNWAPEYFGNVKYGDRNLYSAYGGPAIGTAADAFDMMFNRPKGGISANDLHAIRRMMPYQNVWMFRRAINALEGETAESLGLEGATQGDFVSRLNQ